MFGLLRLLTRLGSFFLFLLLEGICLYLLVTFNENQRSIFWSSANYLSGSTREKVTDIKDYFDLRTRYDSLLAANARLRAQLGNAYYNNLLRQDSARADSTELPLFSYIEARVINNSVAAGNNYLTFDRGALHGVDRHMGVITDGGIVGIVRGASPHYSLGMSLLHSQMRVTAEVKGKGVFGSLSWKGRDPRFLQLEDVPNHQFIEPGDTVQTSVFSRIFPEGIFIGTIEDFDIPQGGSNYRITVRLGLDLAKVRHVYIVNNLMAEELDELEQPFLNE